VAPSDLSALAETVARWVDEVEDVPAVYLFGSRVRGDHRPDSDVDLCLVMDEWGGGDAGTAWWIRQNEAGFADLKAVLPGPLPGRDGHPHRDDHDPALRWVREARADPSRIVLQVRKAVCLWTPPKPARLSGTL
jgi:hypothetical protein